MRVEWVGEKMRGRGREVRERHRTGEISAFELCAAQASLAHFGFCPGGLSLARGVIRVTGLTDYLWRPFLIICNFYKLIKDQGNTVLGASQTSKEQPLNQPQRGGNESFKLFTKKSCNKLNPWFVLNHSIPLWTHNQLPSFDNKCLNKQVEKERISPCFIIWFVHKVTSFNNYNGQRKIIASLILQLCFVLGGISI